MAYTQEEDEKVILIDEEGKIQGYMPDFNLCDSIKLKIIGNNVDYSKWELNYRFQNELSDPWANSDILSDKPNVWKKADKLTTGNKPFFFIPPKLITKSQIVNKQKKYNTAAKRTQKQIKWSNKIELRTKNYAARKGKNNKYFLVYNLVKKEQLDTTELNKLKDSADKYLDLTNKKLKNLTDCVTPEKIKSDSIKKIIDIINSNIKNLKTDRDAYLGSNECCIESILLNIQKEIDELQDSITYYQHLIITPNIIVDGSADNIKTLEEKKTKLETEISEIEKKLNSNRYLVKHLGAIVLGKNTIQPYYKSEYTIVKRTSQIENEVISVDRLGDYPEIIDGDYVYPTLLNVQYNEAKRNPIKMISELAEDRNPPLYDPGFAPIGIIEDADKNKSSEPPDLSKKKRELILESAYTDLVFSVGKPIPGNYKLAVEFKTMGDSTVENTTEEVITKKVNGDSVVTPDSKKNNYFTTTKKYENTTIIIFKDEYPTSHKLYRFGAAFGLLASFLNNPVYTKELVAPASPETGNQDIYIITEKNNYNPSLRPTVFFNINLKRNDLQKKKMNCYERLSIGIGFDLTDITQNFYTGLNFTIWRNFMFSTGAHFGQVQIMNGVQDYNSPNSVNTTQQLKVGYYFGILWNYNIGSILSKWRWQ